MPISVDEFTTGAIYHYFDSKLDIYKAVLAEVQDRVYQRFGAAEREADTFVGAMREKSAEAVLHAELSGGQHAFEVFHSPRSRHAVHGVTRFLEKVHADYEARENAD